MTTAKKATTKKTTATQAVRNSVATKSRKTNVRGTAQRAVNVYLGLLGKSLDVVRDNIEGARKDGKKQVVQLERRGETLRKQLTERIKGGTKRQVNKAQSQVDKVQKQVDAAVEEAIGSPRGKRNAAPKRRPAAKKAA